MDPRNTTNTGILLAVCTLIAWLRPDDRDVDVVNQSTLAEGTLQPSSSTGQTHAGKTSTDEVRVFSVDRW